MKSLKLYLIAASVLLAVYIIALINRPKAVNWSETLSSKDKIPFGTYIFNERLKDIFPSSQIINYRHPLYNALAEDSLKKSSYIIVCEDIDLFKADYGQLMNYLKSGNDVLIASEYFGGTFDKQLKIKTKVNFKLRSEASLIHFTNPYLDSEKYIIADKGTGDVYFSSFDTLRAVVIGENKARKANFIKYSYGKGSLYLVANPKLFSNYSLLTPNGASYAARALSLLKSTPKLIVDQFYTQGEGGDKSPMRLFLSNPTLQWAYYIAVFSLIVCVLFDIKRRQRVIPVIEPLKNSTLDFVTVVGQVYYEKRNNANIAHKKILYLLTNLRDDYQVQTNKLDNEFIDKLVNKLGAERSFAAELVSYFQFIGNQDMVSDSELIELNKLIEKFYTQSR